MTKKKRNWIIAGSVVGGFFLILGVFLLVWFFGDNYDDFYNRATVEFTQPGTEEGYTQQGLTYDEVNGRFLLSGYMTDSSKASRIYVVNAEDDTSKYVELKENDEPFFGHVGGITTYGNTVWLGSEEKVYRLSLSDINSAESGASVNIIDSFKAINNASFMNVKDNKLWIGEFYREKNYKTDESHHMTTASGDKNYAFISCYNIDESMAYGVSSLVPEKILSVTSLVQGMTITDNGKIVLSTSYSLPNSKLYVHENVLSGEADVTFKVEGIDIPVWQLDSSNLLETIDAPCMAEEIVYHDGKVYISFESGCKKYRMFVREQIKSIYSLELA